MRVPVFINDTLKVDVRVTNIGKAIVERVSRLTASLADFVGFQRALDDIRDRPAFALR
ncbi:MAG: hypothetical protein KAG89_19530 [Fulvimarina manganoxydans]|nr:hypothetical protein [Fulvimarina manganoxydans]